MSVISQSKCRHFPSFLYLNADLRKSYINVFHWVSLFEWGGGGDMKIGDQVMINLAKNERQLSS